MKWVKRGLILESDGRFDWMVTHCSIPVAEQIDGDLYRIYFYGRDKFNRSLPGYIEANINEPQKILYITKRPIMGLGTLGAFDDSGVMPSWIINHGGKKYLYYTGWTQGITVPHYFYVGLATSEDGGKNFNRFSPAPILERNRVDPYLTASPCILIENRLWRMWYVSSLKREVKEGELKPFYQIRYAESRDGINWERLGVVCIDLKPDGEYGVSRPCVLKEGGIYQMWYSLYSGTTYSIGYAESLDGIQWERKDDKVGISVSDTGWDSEMIEYAFVFEHEGRKFMLYNGNDYGRSGFGYAVME